MRFRTAIINVALLHKITRSLAALAKTCVIRLSPEQVHFIVPGNEGSTGVQVWSQVKVSTLFDSYKIESNANNEIWLELHLDSLMKVLRSADSSVGGIGESTRHTATLSDADVTLKLNKKGNQPIWAFEIRGKTAARKSMSITHEIDVKILSPKRQQELQEPLCPQPDIHVVLPNLYEMRNLVSRLSHVADDVKVSANHEGTLDLSVNSPRVKLSTTWKDLGVPQSNAVQEDDNEEPPPPPDKMFSANVSIKGLLKFLTSHLVGGTAIACICEDHCLIAYVYIGELNEAGGVLTFFIPAKNTDD
ncbi:HUS1 checkpoint protein [Kwoniella heveanensis BCC8398]|uniref:Checkpoint protein n=1 Tax=Kwoniella heveanensis BCC8398 TaxID=1296120 RepID=A0A1B9GPV2_9TREE|nr:HUS1 checkpoint protein [Kwoniella heveanensis BCC8398]